ncbi:ferric reductase NAD binding domain-containing protein [Biscogniauxia mediterranea]|nr:ferric reductase NAD binding domain-containing protein [Biscogniauxia mediterranea]
MALSPDFSSAVPNSLFLRAAKESASAAAAARDKSNEKVMIQYAAALSSLIGVFILAHWLRFIAIRLHLPQKRSILLYPFTAFSRAVRRVFIRELPGFTSVGHAILVVVYVALNGTFCFYNLDYSKYANLGSRLGWVATGNMTFVIFLALKNTPLAFLTAYSYERLNGLHQIAGYTTLIQSIIHGVMYSTYFLSNGKLHVFHEQLGITGILLGFVLLTSVLAGLFLRRPNYELFYIIHLVLSIVVIITLGLHRPEKIFIATVLIAAMWFSDRILRLGRLAYNSVNNEANIYPLPDGGTRIVLKKPISRARPGKHCYVWLPGIRAFETHPFTIAASEPMELIINTYSGFTRDLHNYAAKNPGASLKVSVEGPYGTNPDPMDYDKVVLVAGGSGATFTFGVTADILGRMAQDSKQQIDFIWAVRGHDNLAWFTQHLNNLRTHVHAPKFALKLHLTRLPAESAMNTTNGRPASVTSDESMPNPPTSPLEKGMRSPHISSPTSPAGLREGCEKEELGQMDLPSAMTSCSDLPIIHGRPDTEMLIKEAIDSVGKDQRILIAACGPAGLLKVVRNTTASCIRVDGPAVELHCEQFGW